MSLKLSVLLAAGSFSVFVTSAPMSYNALARIGVTVTPKTSFQDNSSLNKRGDAYKMYTGNGQTGWPDESQWVSTFNEMFSLNNKILKNSCAQFGVPNNSDQEIADIGSAIQQVASETNVDARFILAVLLQESNGCVRAPTTNGGVRNPGLMQDHNGSATCNDDGHVQNPCPSATITQMIREGAAGTAAGDGLKQTYAKATGGEDTKYYVAARLYNSGSVHSSGDLGEGGATHCYASDIANRLMGWVSAQKTCTLDGAPPPAFSPPVEQPSAPISAPVIAAPNAAPASTSAPAPAPPAQAPTAHTPPAQAPPAPAPVAPVTNTKASSSKMAPGVSTNCAKYYTIQEGDFCYSIAEKFGTTFDKLRTLNTQLDAGCSNLWKGYDYCMVGA